MKHPYYDSEKKKRRDEFSMKAIMFSIVGMILLFIISMCVPSCKNFHDEVRDGIKNDPRPLGPAYNYMHPNHWPDKK